MDAPLIKKNEKGKYGSLAADEKAKHKEGKVLIVDNLDVYNGKTLEAKIDSCITEHPVFMINQSNCLFSKEWVRQSMGDTALLDEPWHSLGFVAI